MASIKESHYSRTYVALYMYTNSAVVQYCLSIELIEYLIKTLARGIKKSYIYFHQLECGGILLTAFPPPCFVTYPGENLSRIFKDLTRSS